MRNKTKFPGLFIQFIFIVWVFLLVSADLKVSIHSSFHWVVTFLFALILLVNGFLVLQGKINIHIWSVTFLFFLFAMNIYCVGIYRESVFYSSWQAMKILSIMLIFYWVCGYFQLMQIKQLNTLYLTPLFISTILLLLTYLMGSTIGGAEDRGGNILTYAGSLWKIGFLMLGYACYLISYNKKLLFASFILFCSLIVIIFDGSRTAFIALILYFIFFGVMIFFRRSILFKVKFLLLLFIGILIFIYFPIDVSILPIRIQEMLNKGLTGEISLERIDEVRYRMNLVGLDAIEEHFFIGSGIGTTKADTSIGPMVIHNTYLQVWADIGFFGLILYLSIVCYGMIFLREFFEKAHYMDLELRAHAINSFLLLGGYVFSGLLHPLSTELSEWILFIVPFATLLGIKKQFSQINYRYRE